MVAKAVDTQGVVRPISWPVEADDFGAVELRRKRKKPRGAKVHPGAREARMFAKTMASWTMDLLNQRDPRWPEADPEADYRNRDWKRMYAGSVLDD